MGATCSEVINLPFTSYYLLIAVITWKCPLRLCLAFLFNELHVVSKYQLFQTDVLYFINPVVESN